MATNIKSLVPAYATHPGEILKEELATRKISQRDFAGQLGIATSMLNEIIHGKRNVNAELAVLLEQALGTDAAFWMRLQAAYELDLVRISEKIQSKLTLMNQWDKLKSIVPLKYFKKQELLTDDKEKDLQTILKIYNANNVDDIDNLVSEPASTYLRNPNNQYFDKAQEIAWTQLVKFKARQITASVFNFKDIDHITAQLRKITLSDQSLQQTSALLSKHGIKFLVVANPDRLPVDGYVYWSDNNPVIAVAQRYNRIDHFFLTVMHAMGHIALHLSKNRKNEFIDDVENIELIKNDKAEWEADDFAVNKLIPPAQWDQFINNHFTFADDPIYGFASKIGIHPSIVRARLCRRFPQLHKKRTSIPNKLVP